MKLYINTAMPEETIIALLDGERELAGKKFKFAKHQAEKLLPAIDKLLSANDFKLSDIQQIIVASQGGSFTSLRIGVVTANALGYALGVPVIAAETGKTGKSFSGYSLVEPIYSAEPNIGKAKKRDF